MTKLTVHENPNAVKMKGGGGSDGSGPTREGDATNTAAPAPRKSSGRSIVFATAVTLAVIGGAYYGHDYWTVGRFMIETDDAYVKADTSSIAPKISGYLSEVLVNDNEVVKAGQPLARIDDRDFQAALDQARANVAADEATVGAKRASLPIQEATIAAAKATIDVDRANETYAEQNNARYNQLSSSGIAPVQSAQLANSQILGAKAAIVRDTATLDAATRQMDLLRADLAQASANLQRDRALQRQAELNLSYATIIAPISGTVGNRTLRVGQYVQAGTQLMSVVPTSEAYVVANYKETQLTDVKPGQRVEISVDMFPDRVYSGHVDSLAPASGQEFALLPPDNATGNFTKVVQRIPVKIILDGTSQARGELRPGMSVQPDIDTRPGSTGQAR